MFLRIVLSYLLLLTGYIAYILHTSAADQLQAGSLWLSSFTSFLLSVFTAFSSFEKGVKNTEQNTEEEHAEIDE